MTSQQKQKSSNLSEEQILKVSKEIVIKFIEVGRVTPSSFDEAFKNIHSSIKKTVNNS